MKKLIVDLISSPGAIALIMLTIGFAAFVRVCTSSMERQRMVMQCQQVDTVVPVNPVEIRQRIAEIDSTIRAKEAVRANLIKHVKEHPMVRPRDSSVLRPNPRMILIKQLDKELALLRIERRQKENLLQITLPPPPPHRSASIAD